MRNVIATVVQTVAVGCLAVGLFLVTPWLCAGVLLAGAGLVLAPERLK